MTPTPAPKFKIGEQIRINRVIHEVSGVYHNLVDDIFEYRLGRGVAMFSEKEIMTAIEEQDD